MAQIQSFNNVDDIIKADIFLFKIVKMYSDLESEIFHKYWLVSEMQAQETVSRKDSIEKEIFWKVNWIVFKIFLELFNQRIVI